MNLNVWAIKWGVPYEALQDLRRCMGAHDDSVPVLPGDSETAIQSQIRLEASGKGLRLWRNNVGATYTSDGSFIRYGLCNDSERMNKKIKSSDLIGIRPYFITQEDVGTTIGQFVAREVKQANWQYTGTPREVAQLNFIELVNSYGGDARFANKEGTL